MGEMQEGAISYEFMGSELDALALEMYGDQPNWVKSMAQSVRSGDLENARNICVQQADKITICSELDRWLKNHRFPRTMKEKEDL